MGAATDEVGIGRDRLEQGNDIETRNPRVQVCNPFGELLLILRRIGRLGLPPALADLILGAVVQRVSAKHPDVHLICREGAAGLVEEVENGSLDLAVISVTSTRSSYRCHLTPLVKEQDYLVTRRDGDPGGSSISIDEVLSMPLVLTPLPNARRQYLDRRGFGTICSRSRSDIAAAQRFGFRKPLPICRSVAMAT